MDTLYQLVRVMGPSAGPEDPTSSAKAKQWLETTLLWLEDPFPVPGGADELLKLSLDLER